MQVKNESINKKYTQIQHTSSPSLRVQSMTIQLHSFSTTILHRSPVVCSRGP